MFQPNWLPNDQDTLRLRAKTTGITETKFVINDLTFKLFDVGGQRSERRKWIGAFGTSPAHSGQIQSAHTGVENVTSVLFLVSLADYNASIIEDRGM